MTSVDGLFNIEPYIAEPTRFINNNVYIICIKWGSFADFECNTFDREIVECTNILLN